MQAILPKRERKEKTMSPLEEQQLKILLNMLSYKELYILAYNKAYEGCNVESAEQVYKDRIVPMLVEIQIKVIRQDLTDSLLNY